MIVTEDDAQSITPKCFGQTLSQESVDHSDYNCRNILIITPHSLIPPFEPVPQRESPEFHKIEAEPNKEPALYNDRFGS